MDDELLSVFINLQNGSPNTHYEIGHSLVTSEALSIKTTVTVEGRLQGSFIPKWFSIIAKECFQRLIFKFYDSSFMDFAPIQQSINEPKLGKYFEDFSMRRRIRWNFKN